MSEMSAEKKKEIERYIIKSYFGGGKNVEALSNGVDIVKGTDDGCIPQLLVEVTYFGGSGDIMIKWNVYDEFDCDSEWENSFALRVCKERTIDKNRCDAVDAMSYAWEAWRERIQGKPIFLKTNDEDLQKDKRIEELERTVKTLKAEKEVMDRHIQELEFHNVTLAETNRVLNNKLNKLDPMPEFKELLKKLYSTDDVEKLEWVLNHTCGGRGSVNGWIAVSTFWKQNYETLSKLVGFSSVEEIEDYLVNEGECDTLHEAISKLHDQVKYTCDEWYSANSRNNSWKAAAECNSPKELLEKLNLLRDDISGRSTVIESYKRDIKKWQAATGYLRPEDISTDSMISKSMANEIKAANERLWSENAKCEKRIEALLSEIREWKTATGSISPKDISTASLVTKAMQLDQEVKILNGALQEWKESTGCPSPSAAKTLIESGASWMSAYHSSCEVIKTWKKLTGFDTPEEAKSRIEGLENAVRLTDKTLLGELEREIDAWQKATGRINPEAAKQYIDRLKDRLNKIHDYSVEW